MVHSKDVFRSLYCLEHVYKMTVVFHCDVCLQNYEFYIWLHVPHYPSLKELSVKCSWELTVILNGHENDLKEVI